MPVSPTELRCEECGWVGYVLSDYEERSYTQCPRCRSPSLVEELNPEMGSSR